MKTTKVIFASVLLSCPFFASAAELDEVAAAKAQVDEYRTLRRACSITKGEQRRVCFSQLKEATEDYRRAKKFLALQEHANKQLLGQAQ